MYISGKARLAGVMGWPIAHSLSPRLHSHWLERYGVDGAYVPLAVHPDNVRDALRALPKLGFRGTNITVPHKEAALQAVDRADDDARRIGAVNTITVSDNGSLAGRNTDGFGFIENIRATLPDWRFDAGPAVVLGAGGAARAVIVALADHGTPEIRLANRTRRRAETLAADLEGPVRVIDWDDRTAALEGAALLVNTTTLGMTGASPLELDLAVLPKDACITDIVYAPLQTDLLKRAAARGNPVVDGLGMLLHQARPAFRAWFGVDPEVDEALRAAVLDGLGN